MNRTILLSLVTALVAGVVAGPCRGQTLQKGISVEMAVTANATSMPAADDANAWVVAVTRDGALFFGTEKFTPDGLSETMKSRPRNRDQKLYIKADARAPFAEVQRVLQAGRTVWFDAAVLLSSQPEQAAPGTIVPPKGLEVLVGAPSGAEAVVVEVSRSDRPAPRLTVNGADVSEAALSETLKRALSNGSGKLVALKVDGQLTFSQVAHVIDACRGAGVKVAVDIPEV